MNRILYRVKSNHKGVFSAIKEQMNQDEWHEFLKSDIANWLPNPGADLYEKYDCVTFFTEEGFEKFNQTIRPFVEKFIPITIDLINDMDENVVYSDRYQKVFNRGAFHF